MIRINNYSDYKKLGIDCVKELMTHISQEEEPYSKEDIQNDDERYIRNILYKYKLTFQKFFPYVAIFRFSAENEYPDIIVGFLGKNEILRYYHICSVSLDLDENNCDYHGGCHGNNCGCHGEKLFKIIYDHNLTKYNLNDISDIDII